MFASVSLLPLNSLGTNLFPSQLQGVAIIDILENVDGIGQLRSTYPEKNILFIKADVADKTAIDEAYEEITKSFEYLDIVVNVAGIFNDLDVSRTIGVNIVSKPNQHVLHFGYKLVSLTSFTLRAVSSIPHLQP